jgi:cytochrome b involved in lipid metabolism
MKKKIIIGICIFVVFVIGAIAILTKKIDLVKPVKVEQVTASSTTLYTFAEVQKHKTSTDCWTMINGNVYNVTSWITQHPGGAQAIIYLCGIDGSAAFNAQHGGQVRPASELSGFLIGTLKK